MRPNISGPFGFQHVTHTDQGQFQSLNSTTSTELVCEFNAVQTAQSPAGQIKGISVDDLPASPRGALSQGWTSATVSNSVNSARATNDAAKASAAAEGRCSSNGYSEHQTV